MARTYTLASGVATGYRIWPPSGNFWTFQASSATNAGPAYSTNDPLDIRELDKDSRLVGDGTPGTFVPPETPQVVRVKKSTGELRDEDGDLIPVAKVADLALNPDLLIASVSAFDSATDAPTAGTLRWPDGATGTFTGTADAFGIASYVLTHVKDTVTTTYTQPTMTRDSSGRITARPAITVS